MCTLTWHYHDDGYFLAFNRDEKKTRQTGSPPERVSTTKNSHYISPIDTQRGGTWIGSNPFGITCCLLNYYDYIAPQERSRGDLIPQLMGYQYLTELEDHIQQINTALYAGFELVIFSKASEPVCWTWDGKTLSKHTLSGGFKTSSSFGYSTVRETRHHHFKHLVPDNPTLADLVMYHQSHSPIAGPYSTCVHRHQIQTVSLTTVNVSPTQTTMAYYPGSPCTVSEPLPLSLDHTL